MGHVRGDVPVENDNFAGLQRLLKNAPGFEPIAGKQKRDQKGMHRVEGAVIAVQEFADCPPEQR